MIVATYLERPAIDAREALLERMRADHGLGIVRLLEPTAINTEWLGALEELKEGANDGTLERLQYLEEEFLVIARKAREMREQLA